VSLDYTGDSTFGAARFLVVSAADLARPVPPTTARFKAKQSATGARTVFQVAGNVPAQYAIPLVLLTAQYVALRALVGTVATLALIGDTPRAGVFLASLDGVQQDDVAGIVELRATFWGA